MQEKKEILLSIIDTVVALGKRYIPFRDTPEVKRPKGKTETLSFLLIGRLYNCDPVLKSHLSHCNKNATY